MSILLACAFVCPFLGGMILLHLYCCDFRRRNRALRRAREEGAALAQRQSNGESVSPEYLEAYLTTYTGITRRQIIMLIRAAICFFIGMVASAILLVRLVR